MEAPSRDDARTTAALKRVVDADNATAPRCATMSVATLAGTVGIDPFPALRDSVKGMAMPLPRPEASRYAPGHRRRQRETQG